MAMLVTFASTESQGSHVVTFTQYPRMIRDRLVRVQGGKWKILVSDVQFISLHMAIVERK